MKKSGLGDGRLGECKDWLQFCSETSECNHPNQAQDAIKLIQVASVLWSWSNLRSNPVSASCVPTVGLLHTSMHSENRHLTSMIILGCRACPWFRWICSVYITPHVAGVTQLSYRWEPFSPFAPLPLTAWSLTHKSPYLPHKSPSFCLKSLDLCEERGFCYLGISPPFHHHFCLEEFRKVSGYARVECFHLTILQISQHVSFPLKCHKVCYCGTMLSTSFECSVYCSDLSSPLAFLQVFVFIILQVLKTISCFSMIYGPSRGHAKWHCILLIGCRAMAKTLVSEVEQLGKGLLPTVRCNNVDRIREC